MQNTHMKTKNFTTTLPIPLLEWLDEIAQETKQPKNKILETALKTLKRSYTGYQIEKSYAKAAQDPEWIFFGDAGLDDWLKNIEKWEK